MNSPKRLTVGEILAGIRAEDHNAFCDAWTRVVQLPQKATPTGQGLYPNRLVVTIFNTEAAITVDFPILKISAPTFTVSDRESLVHQPIPFDGATPDADTKISDIVIVQGPIGTGATGKGHGVLLGHTYVDVDVTDAAHTHAAPIASDNTKLASGTTGAKIIWKPAGTGVKKCVVMLGGGSETFRLIRGQSVGAQSTGTVLIDNVVVLSGGEDPTGGNPTVQVSVDNVFSQSYADNEWIDAVYSPGFGTDWETLKTTSGVNNFRAIRGRVTADVSADDTSFSIDNIVLLAASDDPRSTPGSTTETLSIASLLNESFPAGTNITAIYSPAVDTDIDWELIVVERYRALRGLVYSQASTTLTVDHIVPLDHGDDPRVNTTDVTETISVEVLNGDTFTNDDKVWADYNASLDQWEARPKGAGGGDTIIVKLAAGGTITRRSGTTRGSGSVDQMDSDLTTVITSSMTVYNLSSLDYVASSSFDLFGMATKIGADYYINAPDVSSLPSFNLDNDQSIGHDGTGSIPSGLPKWQDDKNCGT